jgi:hypothetical protein
MSHVLPNAWSTLQIVAGICFSDLGRHCILRLRVRNQRISQQENLLRYILDIHVSARLSDFTSFCVSRTCPVAAVAPRKETNTL